MKNIFKVLYFVLMCFSCYNSSALSTVLIHPSTNECNTEGTVLTCDFENSQEAALLGDLTRGKTSTLTKVSIHNIKKVVVERVNCVDLIFRHVDDIQFIDTSYCRKKINSMWLYSSNANTVPQQLNRLELSQSTVDKISCEMGLQRLSIWSSHVNELHAPLPFSGQVTIKIEASTIDILTSLKLEARSSLVVVNSTINNIVYDGLSLGRGASASILQSTINNCEEHCVHVKLGGKLAINYVKGKIHILGSHPSKNDYKRPPGVPDKHSVITPDDMESMIADAKKQCDEPVATWMWFCPTVLAAVESLLLIILWGRKYRGKSKIPKIHLKEDSEFATGLTYRKQNNDGVEEFYNEGQSATQMHRRRR